MQKALDILDAFCIHTGMANHVRHLREELGLTQRDFAAEMGVVRSTVFRWENRRETLPRSVEILLAAVAEKHGIEWPPQLRAA